MSGIIDKYLLEGSVDGKSWDTLSTGEFSNISNNPFGQEIKFEMNSVRYIQLTALFTLNGENPSFAELGIISKK